MPLYEIMCISTLQSTPQQLVNMLQRLSTVVQKGKGVFRRVEHLGTRPLAYRMKAHMKYNTVGRYLRLYIQASPLLCRDVETRLRVDDNIVRTMTIKHLRPAPVVVEKRVRNLNTLNSSSMTGVLSHAPIVEYNAARTLLALGLLKGEEILALPRYEPDAGWEALRASELLRRSQDSSAARALLSVPIPTRQEDLALMKERGDKEEEEMQAYETYRKANNQRKVRDAAQYDADEEAALARRWEWYSRSGQRMRDRNLAFKMNKGRRPLNAAHQEKILRNAGHPLAKKRFTRGGKAIPPPAWVIKDRAAEAEAQRADTEHKRAAKALQEEQARAARTAQKETTAKAATQ